MDYYVELKISNIPDVKSVSKSSFVDGDVYVIDTYEGFNFGNLLRKITCIMEDEKNEKNFNCERILFYTKDGKRFDFGSDNIVLKTGDYFNVAIIKDTSEQLSYAHQVFWKEEHLMNLMNLI